MVLDQVSCDVIGGATTLSIMTFSIMTLSIMTLSIMTFSIMTFSIMTLNVTIDEMRRSSLCRALSR